MTGERGHAEVKRWEKAQGRGAGVRFRRKDVDLPSPLSSLRFRYDLPVPSQLPFPSCLISATFLHLTPQGSAFRTTTPPFDVRYDPETLP